MCNYVDIFTDVLKDYHNADKWQDSAFGEMKKISNTHVGAVGQKFIEQLCIEFQIPCEFPQNASGGRATQSPWDMKINGVTFELKTATEDINYAFQFNHIRYHRPYEAVLCLGVSPESLYFNLWSKADITTNKAGTLVSMEKGANASYKLTKRKNELKDISLFYDEIMKFTD